MNLNISKSCFNESFYPLLFDYSHRWEVYCGSAGSGKSYFIAEKLVIRALTQVIRILICRKYATTIRQTVFANVKEVLKKFHIIDKVKVNETDYRIRFPNGSELIFSGLDEETKLLSLTDISCVWVEEAFEVERDLVEQLNLRMRGRNEGQQIIMSFNPISSSSWLYEFCEVDPPESFVFHRSTFKDNKFLREEYVNSILELEHRNPKKWRIYGLGLWGQDTEGLVFNNWEVKDIEPTLVAKLFEHRCGCDLGWNDPSAIVESFFDPETHTIYVTQEYYAKGQTLDDLLNAIYNMHINKCKIQFDSAEPRSIDFFKNKNIWAVPCKKGTNSVNARIAFLQNNNIVVDPKCKNVINELQNFSYVKDRKTGQYTDKTTHEFSHTLDALGYAYSDLYTLGRMKCIDKSILGL